MVVFIGNHLFFSINNYKNEIYDTLVVSSVSEIMSSNDIVTVPIDSQKTIQDVANLMIKKKVGSVIVIDTKMQPLGIITERDIIKRVCLENFSSNKILVEEIMSTPLITVMSYDSVDTASRIMTKNRIKHLVVLEDDNRITGLLSVTDITKKLAKILLNDYKRHRSLRFAIDLS
jgi:signal-transduction protein with cAMP-binding, CBS, and nucleotidyltransferase domain